MENKTDKKYTIKDYGTGSSRWCAGCGDFGIIAAEKTFLSNKQIDPYNVVNVSGIGCSGRTPYYLNTYGIHSIHGRAIPVAMGLALTRPELKLFIHSGDGDAISIGCGHLVHGVNKNFNCVFMLYDNQIYSLTKNQSSPTTRKGHVTNTQPFGTLLDPINPVSLVLGVGGSFIASSADWMPDHLTRTIDAAFEHQGFSFIHISQRCPHFDPDNYDVKNPSWFSFMESEKGIEADKRFKDKTEVIKHDPTNREEALKLANSGRRYFGLFYHDTNKPRYDDILIKVTKDSKQKKIADIFDPYKI